MNDEVPAAPVATIGSAPQIGPSLTLRRDARVEPAYGSAGRLKHVILDPETHEITDLGVNFQDQEWLVPIAARLTAPPRLTPEAAPGGADAQAAGESTHSRGARPGFSTKIVTIRLRRWPWPAYGAARR